MNPANEADSERHKKADMLAAVLLSLMTDGGAQPMSAEQLATESERNSERQEDREEVAFALRLLTEYELVTEGQDGRWHPTRAAVESARLSI